MTQWGPPTPLTAHCFLHFCLVQLVACLRIQPYRSRMWLNPTNLNHPIDQNHLYIHGTWLTQHMYFRWRLVSNYLVNKIVWIRGYDLKSAWTSYKFKVLIIQPVKPLQPHCNSIRLVIRKHHYKCIKDCLEKVTHHAIWIDYLHKTLLITNRKHDVEVYELY